MQPIFRSRCNHIGKNVMVERIPFCVGHGTIIIKDNVKISGQIGIGFNNKLPGEKILKIGEKTFIGHGSTFLIAKGIQVGANCYLANSCVLMDNDGHIHASAIAQSENDQELQFLQWWTNFWTSANADSKMRQQMDHLLSIMDEE